MMLQRGGYFICIKCPYQRAGFRGYIESRLAGWHEKPGESQNKSIAWGSGEGQTDFQLNSLTVNPSPVE